MSPNKIAVAIPTYKRREMLDRLIGTIPSDWSIYVSDNDSSLLPLDPPIDGRVKVSHSPVLVEMFANWNRALSLVDADCTHVFIPSDDDLFLPEARAIVADALRQHADADILVFGCDFIDGQDHKFGGYVPTAQEVFATGDGFTRFAYSVDARLPGILIRQDFLKRIGAFDEKMEITAADSDFVQRALLLGKSVFVPKVIGRYRYWNGSGTHAFHGTDRWMKDVVRWTDKITQLLRTGHRPIHAKVDIDQYRAEVINRNVLAGVDNLIAKGDLVKARDFFWRHAVFKHATLLGRLRLLRCLWRLRSTRMPA